MHSFRVIQVEDIRGQGFRGKVPGAGYQGRLLGVEHCGVGIMGRVLIQSKAIIGACKHQDLGVTQELKHRSFKLN